MGGDRMIGVALDLSKSIKKALSGAIDNLLDDGDTLVLYAVPHTGGPDNRHCQNQSELSLNALIFIPLSFKSKPLNPSTELRSPFLGIYCSIDWEIKHLAVENRESMGRKKKKSGSAQKSKPRPVSKDSSSHAGTIPISCDIRMQCSGTPVAGLLPSLVDPCRRRDPMTVNHSTPAASSSATSTPSPAASSSNQQPSNCIMYISHCSSGGAHRRAKAHYAEEVEIQEPD